MAASLKLQVVMSMVDKALAPLRGIDRQAKATAQGLRQTRDTLKALERAQDDVGEFRKVRQALRGTATDMEAARAKAATLARQLAATESPTRAMQREFSKAQREAAALGDQHQQLAAKAQQLRDKLQAAGISTRTLGADERELRQRIDATAQSITRQTAALKAQGDQHRKMAALKEAHGKRMAGTAAMAGAGVAGVVTGAAVARPVAASMGAYAEQENATTQLKASMMESDGSVAADFEKIDALAQRLGDRLPGTTAEFTEMMTVLKRQGLSAKSILGGTGEAAALLGVQLRMPVTEAAEFAAKMQDATSTTEKDMLGLMDMIQRTYYLGVDSTNMLQGFGKLSPAMSMMKKEGLEAAKILAPMLVMMDQKGMPGEQAGNAIRKVVQAGFDEKKAGKANALLKKNKAGFTLDFTDGKGEFGGVEKMFAQLKQLEKLSTQKRTSVIKELFGDDAETLDVLNVFLSKGIDGYKEVVGKMQAQADLRKRVDLQLGTITNAVEAAQGTWTNVLAAIGETVAPDAKKLVIWLAEAAASVGAWVKANPQLVAWLTKAAAAVAVLYVGIGGLMVGLAGVLAPLLMVRFALAAIGVQGGVLALVLRGLGAALRFVGAAAAGLLRLLVANPIVAAVAAIAVAAYLIYRHWGAISAFFAGLWQRVQAGSASAWQAIAATLAAAWQAVRGMAASAWQAVAGAIEAVWLGLLATARSVWQQLGGSFPAVLAAIGAAIVNWSPLGLFYQAFAGVMGYFGLELPQRFTEFGRNIVQGLANGIASTVGMVRDAIGTAADSAIGWFKEKLGIHSPSRVFLAAGINVGEGAALGIEGTQRMVRSAAGAMAAAAAVALPAPALAAPPALPDLVQRVALAAPAPLAPQLLQLAARPQAMAPPALPQPAAPQAPAAPAQPAGQHTARPMPAPALPAPAIAPPVLPALPDIVQRIVSGRPPQVPDMVQRIVAGTPPQVPDLVQRLALAVPQAMPLPASAADGAPPALAQVQPLAPIDRRPPLMAPQAPRPAAAPPAAPAAGDRFEIHIHAAPGMDMQALAGMVKQQMERYEADKRARAGGGFYDLSN